MSLKNSKSIWSGEVVATIDMLWAIVIILFALVLSAITNPDTVKPGDKPVCVLAFDMEWPAANQQDIDLWVKPSDDIAVGFPLTNQHGKTLDIIRDEVAPLPRKADNAMPFSERICAHEILANTEYVVNVHFYAQRTPNVPVPVHVTVTEIDPHTADTKKFVDKVVYLKAKGHEITIARFKTNDAGLILINSINDIPFSIIGTK